MSLLKKDLLRTEMTEFESALYLGTLFKNTLSKIYRMLSNKEGAADTSRIKWQTSIKKEISEKEWYVSHRLIRSV